MNLEAILNRLLIVQSDCFIFNPDQKQIKSKAIKQLSDLFVCEQQEKKTFALFWIAFQLGSLTQNRIKKESEQSKWTGNSDENKFD